MKLDLLWRMPGMHGTTGGAAPLDPTRLKDWWQRID